MPWPFSGLTPPLARYRSTAGSLPEPQPIGNERCYRLSGRVSPPDAKRVACRVCVDLMAFLGVQVARLEQSGAEPDRRIVRSLWISDVEVEMYLLRSAIRPLRRNVVWNSLHADEPLAGGTDDGMKLVIAEDVPAEDPRPEAALGVKIGGVEHNHLTHHVHCRRLPTEGCAPEIEG